MSTLSYPDGAQSVLLVLLVSIPTIVLMYKYAPGNIFLINIFLIALYARLALSGMIHFFDLSYSLGPDSNGYHVIGERLMEIWLGRPVPGDLSTYRALNPGNSGWGMYSLVAAIYTVFGPSKLVAQSFCCVVGAITAVLAYSCSQLLFNNNRVSKVAATLVAVFPSFIIFSAQLLKEGLLIFLLLLVMIMVIKLQKKFSYFAVISIVLALFGILSLRFYLFFMVVLSIGASLAIGEGTSAKTLVRNAVVIVIVGLGLTYLGAINIASSDFEKYGDLERVQTSRQDLATSADSGFGEDLDVSTPMGALAAVPIGLAYLFFAPFPWEITKTSQLLVLPETFVWWGLIPLMLGGFAYTLRRKVRRAIPILMFCFLLTISYSIFQGNVGMLYRQRTQIQVFFFMFVGVGWVVLQERRENKKALEEAKRRHVDMLLAKNRDRTIMKNG